ncbi:prepilin-type cleavage/methylation domain-containing protein [Pseudoalteromonas aurantia]|uniref:prepilin-type N-terminal cleavage/methylation domain-containing protein n=1 Tax=Pseudoalteromonas aurantia TaxID=43654 RepID=UPI00110B8480|nr:prepilin-type N-terminal cleavage/methylation domain-containing protein [Pseudoalteromonas aurantia]TMO67096.1 prepilin-type cleavage/methylation domain-containing protein [Pseudoalteromonas aurantia]
MNKPSGFTLIEMLIVTTLLTLVLYTGNYVYYQLYSRWDKQLGDFEEVARVTKVSMQLDSLMSGIQPFVIRTPDDIPVFFFEGNESTLLAVSSTGIIHNREPVVFRLGTKVEKDRISLTYQSLPLSSLILNSTTQEIVFSTSITLLQDVEEFKFRYHGWRSLELKSARQGVPIWSDKYSGISQRLTPHNIELKISTLSNSLTLNTNLTTESNAWFRHYFNSSNI